MSAVAMKTHTKQLIDTLSDMEVSLVLNYINSFIKQRNEMNMESEIAGRVAAAKSLFGILPKEADIEIAKAERLELK